MKLAARLILWDIPVWLLYAAVALVLDIIGLVLLLPLSACHAWRGRDSMVYDVDKVQAFGNGREVTAWHGGWLTWLWGNEEDGVTGPEWWAHRTGTYFSDAPWWRKAWATYRWSALRNPVNNLRFVPGINPVIRPEDVEWSRWDSPWTCLGPVDHVCQGPYAGIICFPIIGDTQFRFWLGWKLKPEDRAGVKDTDMRKPRCGFAMQFKRV